MEVNQKELKYLLKYSVDWLYSRVGAEKDISDWSKKLGTITFLNPTQYPNIDLFFMGHLDSDMIKEVEIFPEPATDKLTESFMKIGSQSTVANIGSE